jgi:hypothetical protein
MSQVSVIPGLVTNRLIDFGFAGNKWSELRRTEGVKVDMSVSVVVEYGRATMVSAEGG